MKSKKVFVIFSIVIIALFCFSACRQTGPWSIQEAIWYSENPEIKIIKNLDTNWGGYIIVGGELKDIELLWGPSRSFKIVDADYEIISDEIILLSGVVSYNDNSATLKIEKDNVFNNKYKEIVLYRRAIEENE